MADKHNILVDEQSYEQPVPEPDKGAKQIELQNRDVNQLFDTNSSHESSKSAEEEEIDPSKVSFGLDG